MSPPAFPDGRYNGRPGWHYEVPETGTILHSTGIGALYDKLWVVLVANNLDISEGWKDKLHDELCEQMPHVKCVEIINPETHPTVIAGRAAWKELHEYAWSYPDYPLPDAVEAAKAWLDGWRQRIPSYGCACKRKFAAIEQARPVDLRSRHDFWQWTVEIHNDVNRKLGKPLWSPG